MPLPQQKFREIVFQLLYSHDFVQEDEEEVIPFLMNLYSVTKSALREADARKKQIWELRDTFDRLIADASKSYDFHRIPRIERSILRLGLFELLHDENIPPKVAISEAIRLCRKFATAEGATFVNAILDQVYQSHGLPVGQTP